MSNTKATKTMRTALALGFAAVCVGVVSMESGQADTSSPATGQSPARPVDPVVYSGKTRPLPPTGQAPSAGQALAATLSGLDQSQLGRLQLSPVSGSGYKVVGSLAATNSPIPKSEWEADLAIGALAERLADNSTADLASVITGVTYKAEDGSATETANLSGSVGDVAPGQKFGANGMTDAQIVATAKSVFSSDAATVEDVQVLHALDPAVYVKLRLTGTGSLPLATLEEQFLGQPPQFEGIYIEVVDSADQPAAITCTSLRTGVSRQWVSPDHQGTIASFPSGAQMPRTGR